MFLLVKSSIKKILPENVKRLLIKILSLSTDIRYKIILYFLNSNASLKFVTQAFTFHTLELRKFKNIENIATIAPHNIEYLFNNSELLYYSPPVFDLLKLKDSHLVEVTDHNNYAAILNEAMVIGGSNLVLLEKQNALYDIKQYDSQKRYRYTDEAIQYYKNDYCLVKINDSKISFNEAIFLGGNYSWNYYHLLYEILIKFEQIDCLNLDINIPILVDKICFEVPQYLELFSILNKKERKMIPLNKGERYKVKQLFYFSCPNFIPPNFNNENDIQPADVLFNLKSLDYLRKNLLPLSAQTNFPKRIYISRSKASGRRQFNEDDVFDVLEKYGFKTVCPENYSIADQIIMFNTAEFIAGGSGAAFTNLLFCYQSCKVFIFSKNKIPFSGFSTIASYVGLEMLYFTEELSCIDDMKNIHESFHINTDKLNTLVADWIQQ